MKVILFGSSGMVGQGVLNECLKDDQIKNVLVINREPITVSHPKLQEVLLSNLFELKSVKESLSGYDSCLYCVGITSAGLTEAEYSKNIYELTISIAKLVLSENPAMKFCYISGTGTDSTEKGKIMWARVKGKTENELLRMPFKQAYMFRPGYIQPINGIKSRTKLYNALYFVFKPFYFMLKHFENMVTSTEILGKAMIIAAKNGYKKQILESININDIVKSNP